MHKRPDPNADSLYIPTTGEWSRDKHYYLERYIDAFTTSMKGKWEGLHYVDLFAGAGLVRLRETGELSWGSPMIAAYAANPLDRLHLCELGDQKFAALENRVRGIRPDSQLLHGDANERIHDIVTEIPKTRTLTLAFLDPYGLHLDFETLRILSDIRADLIILFPDHLDALRNWEHHYLNDPDSNLDRCLGDGSDWRSIIDGTSPDRVAEVLRKLYVQQITSLGYTHFEYRRIYSKNHPLYILVFCSRSEFAAKLWTGISHIEHDGQRRFRFEQ